MIEDTELTASFFGILPLKTVRRTVSFYSFFINGYKFKISIKHENVNARDKYYIFTLDFSLQMFLALHTRDLTLNNYTLNHYFYFLRQVNLRTQSVILKSKII